MPEPEIVGEMELHNHCQLRNITFEEDRDIARRLYGNNQLRSSLKGQDQMESIHTCPWPQLCTDSDANTGWSNGRKSINSRRRSHFRESTCPEGNNIWAGINVACCFSLLVVKGCNFFRRVRAILPTPEAMNCSHARNGMQGASWRNSYNRI